jgi:sugar phosphate isomerase/epimerase
MRKGFLTVALGKMPLEEKALWAEENGFDALEIACWPQDNDRDYSSCDIDVETLTMEKADEIKKFLDDKGIMISSLAYYDNNLDSEPTKRAFVNNHTKKVIDAAAMLGTPYVGTFTGRDITKSIKDNFVEFEKVFSELVSYADKKEIGLMIENCDMLGWQRSGEPGTISYSPELWEEMFKRVPAKNFGLNYDPSHLVLMLMDHISPIKEFKDRIFHVHAKDAAVNTDALDRYGVFGRKLGKGMGYRDFRMPGLGSVDWQKLMDALKDIGYNYVLSIEHEDPDFEGSEEKVKKGLLVAKENIDKYI